MARPSKRRPTGKSADTAIVRFGRHGVVRNSFERSNLRAPKNDLFQGFQADPPAEVPMQKYIPFLFSEIDVIYAGPASIKRGVSRSSRTLGAGCGGRVGVAA
jgi:hypothetical protein